ncbi:MAG: hypothetical protein ACOVQX_00870 [Legionella sp.]
MQHSTISINEDSIEIIDMSGSLVENDDIEWIPTPSSSLSGSRNISEFEGSESSGSNCSTETERLSAESHDFLQRSISSCLGSDSENELGEPRSGAQSIAVRFNSISNLWLASPASVESENLSDTHSGVGTPDYLIDISLLPTPRSLSPTNLFSKGQSSETSNPAKTAPPDQHIYSLKEQLTLFKLQQIEEKPQLSAKLKKNILGFYNYLNLIASPVHPRIEEFYMKIIHMTSQLLNHQITPNQFLSLELFRHIPGKDRPLLRHIGYLIILLSAILLITAPMPMSIMHITTIGVLLGTGIGLTKASNAHGLHKHMKDLALSMNTEQPAPSQ